MCCCHSLASRASQFLLNARNICFISGNELAARLIAEHPAYNVSWELLPRLFNVAAGGRWRKQWGWCTGTPLGKWLGVTVEETTGAVTGIDLAANNLFGTDLMCFRC